MKIFFRLLVNIRRWFQRRRRQVSSDHAKITTRSYWPNDREVTEQESCYIAQHMQCPDCGAVLMEGPCGGLSINVYCSGCPSRFNAGPIEEQTGNFYFTPERITSRQ